MADFLAKLRPQAVTFCISVVPEFELRHVNILDPDGNHTEIAFPAEEQVDLSDFAGGA